MSDIKMDRRVQKTCQLLQEALITLILEKGYDAVTVQDILDKANVGRSTFYAHYQDKEALLASHLEALERMFETHAAEALARHSEEHTGVGNLPLFALRYVEHNHRLFKALIGKRGGGAYVAHFQNFLLTYTRRIIKNFVQDSLTPYQAEITVQCLANSYLSVLIWWIDSDMPCPAEEVYAVLMRLIEPGLKEVLHVQSLWS
jgi:AcrR family transcriptional regulator